MDQHNHGMMGIMICGLLGRGWKSKGLCKKLLLEIQRVLIVKIGKLLEKPDQSVNQSIKLNFNLQIFLEA